MTATVGGDFYRETVPRVLDHTLWILSKNFDDIIPMGSDYMEFLARDIVWRNLREASPFRSGAPRC
jgi:hypothetical protein